jgi:hypothetical protein
MANFYLLLRDFHLFICIHTVLNDGILEDHNRLYSLRKNKQHRPKDNLDKLLGKFRYDLL